MKRILFFIAILIPFITFGQSEKVFVIADSTLADQWTTLGNIWRHQKGDDMTLAGTAVFTNNKETNHGIIALVLDSEKVALAGMAMIGWKRLGISRKVTKSKDKLLYSIDDKPAVYMYLKYLGKGGGRDINLLNELSFNFPFIVERENEDDIFIKTPMHIDHEENALVMDVEMKEGEAFWFSIPPDFDIVDKIIHDAREVKNAFADDADAMLVFSCAGREPAL